MTSIHAALARAGLVRDTSRTVLGGVCSGLAARHDLDPWAVRLLLVVALMVVPGSQFLVYPLLWVLMPSPEAARRSLGRENESLVLTPDTVQDVVPAPSTLA